jgi:predicted dehydrogenase
MANRSDDVKRVLVVGGGLIGLRHIEAVRAHAGCHLVGLVDPDPEIGFDGTRFDRMEDVTTDGDTGGNTGVDGVIIATPTGLHADHGMYAARRGWHMLIEKPVAGTLAEAHALQAAVAQAGVGSLVGHHRRYHASVQQLKTVIADGEIGTPVAANLIWAMRKPDAYFEGNWRTAGGSPVMINLVHDIDILRFVLGEITQIAALRGASLRGTQRIESGAVALAFQSGATANISFADTSPSPWGFEAGTGENPNIGTTHQDMMWIMGSKGAISFPSMTLWAGTDWGSPAQTRRLAPAKNVMPPLAAQLDHFLAVMDGAVPMIDVADATRSLAITLDIEAQLSAARNQPERVAS